MNDERSQSVTGIDQIRDIVFGATMQSYDQRFQAVERNLDRLQRALDEAVAALRADASQTDADLRGAMASAVAALQAEIHQASGQLTSAKVDRFHLGDMLMTLGARLKGADSPGDEPAERVEDALKSDAA